MSVEVLEQIGSVERLQSRLSDEKVAYLGRLAISSESLGINDPLTHLYQYLRHSEHALVGIKQDIETDIAERLPKTPFINYVDFDFNGADFLSVKDKVSMHSMTANNLKFMMSESASNPSLTLELARARIESEEVNKLINWYKTAPLGSYYIFESLPIGSQTIAVSRVYQKKSDDKLGGCFVSLYNPSVAQFNRFRKAIAGEVARSDELDILAHGYTYFDARLEGFDNFIDDYVKTYDGLILELTGEKSQFGIKGIEFNDNTNGIAKVRSQSKLTSIYIEAVKILATSGGEVTPEVISIKEKLGIDLGLYEGQLLTTKLAQSFLKRVITGITSAIYLSPDSLLEKIEATDSGLDYAVVASSGEQARLSGDFYESNNCPEFGAMGQAGVSDSESSALTRAYNGWELMKGFGEAKVGVCRIYNCPSRGDIDWLPGKTLVGGCDICVGCHKHFMNGKKPEAIYLETA